VVGIGEGLGARCTGRGKRGGGMGGGVMAARKRNSATEKRRGVAGYRRFVS